MAYLIVIVICCAITLYIHSQISDANKRDIEDHKIELNKLNTTRQILCNREAELEKQKTELELRSRAMFSLDKLFPVDDLIKLHKSSEHIESDLKMSRGKAQKYVQRLLRLNEDKKEAFRTRPILTVSTTMLSTSQLFNGKKEAFLQRERELCLSVLKEGRLESSFVTNDITQIDITTVPKECRVVYVVDGDTYDVVINNNKYRIRAAGFDTPEVCHPKKGYGHWGFKSSEAAKRIIENGKTFRVWLDSEGYKQRWCNDRYGRVIAHISVDGELIGQRLLREGNAEYLDVFPLDTAVRSEYERSEHFAKLNNAGMWEEINRFNLEKKQFHEKSKWSLDMIQNNHKDIALTTSLLKDMMKEMLGNMVIKSKNSIILHKENCFHTRRMTESETVSVTDDMLSSNNDVRPCKHCHGDDLSLELYGVS